MRQEVVSLQVGGPRSQPGPPGVSVSFTSRAALAVVLTLSCVGTLVVDLPALAAANSKDKKAKQDSVLKGLPVTELSAEEAIQHALNRFAYGPRPGDAERIRQMGLAKWIDQQLTPKSIDDSAVEERLTGYPTLRMASAQLLAEYPNPKQAAKPAAAPKQELRPVEAAQKQADDAIAAMAREMGTNEGPSGATAENNMTASAPSAPDSPSPMKLNPATRGLGKNDPLNIDPNVVPKAISDDSKRLGRAVEELGMAKMQHAIYSERQLQQVMDDFWFNHFNVFAGKGEVKWYLTSYERDVIEPRALGKFKDLVTATAKSPAMLFYLDNFLSVDPNAQERLAAQRAMRQRRWPNGHPPRPI